MSCIDTNPATDSLAEILYELIDICEGGNDLADAARVVETFFHRADYDFGKQTLEKLEALRIDFDTERVHTMYRALQKIEKCAGIMTAQEIARYAMRKARGESEVSE